MVREKLDSRRIEICVLEVDAVVEVEVRPADSREAQARDQQQNAHIEAERVTRVVKGRGNIEHLGMELLVEISAHGFRGLSV